MPSWESGCHTQGDSYLLADELLVLKAVKDG